jgi:hypothetical protein
MIKSRRMRWTGHVTHETAVHTSFGWEILKERDHYKRPKILEQMLKTVKEMKCA